VTRVLVVEDEESYSDALSYMLRKEGFQVAVAATGTAALDEFGRNGADIVLLDLMLPELSGTEVCRRIRQSSNVPVIMVTAKDDEVDKVVGLELGADDYVTKPFSPRELAARVRTVLRRARAAETPSERLSFGDVELDAATRDVRRAGVEVRLTAKEFDLLWFLASHPRRVFGRDQLMSRVWGYEAALDTGTVTVHVRRLREKIEVDPSAPRHLQTVWGVGYRLAP
jgi:two-component system, OmpR family, response regulator RegX3